MQDYTILTDSSCDLTDDMKQEVNAADAIPFYINISGQDYVDDHTLDVPFLLRQMKACTEKMTTACASPLLWKEAFLKAGRGFALTISAKLSGSYASANVGLNLAKEEDPAIEGFVFDSKSASSGEVLLSYKIRNLIESGAPFRKIIEDVNAFIEAMKTFFVLDDVSNLVKNGRMNKITGTLVTVLGIKPVLGAKDGEIELYGKALHAKNIADKLLDAVADSGRVINGDDLVISHCFNPNLAAELLEKACARFRFGKGRIVATKGLSSFYASNKGVIMSF